ncbi:MAG: branched-chain amino acid ABC transporter substrate-binding protein [Pseudodesulfovibrio sp.]|uniref:Extracellular ligand-binding receptor n=1 Tax=Pseudodesulfovibrio aespoeensis (strain ATCC 700646 / DSM 10631 / Aspo-2) TaxID=643562 RepID=E6VUV8_PSEA9|nr:MULTISPECIES: branched-chain amino acid ABC transporter substrate-binding protein [Pseudodesulfovibrio]MBU4191119.1 branched-chain amino acid ABC transporter substrate-binding protein [Pseudomonadota bacterium]ADU63466.1 Extracellular ligand-binding receptor [Pseudodesulfovibrio aespoeensis Aspo-2]MBU4243083.1 branched-chain amino acid ABC transporter substrate-binding protein [Pseudomonadota bacterium]MBU4378433.1 branched-chain amino acid ABC transporter substrate-binding protein [Pseudomo
MRTKLHLIVLCLVMAAMLAACSAEEKKADEKADVQTGEVAPAAKLVLGVAGAHSGDLASYGLPSVNAAKLVAAKVNAAGGVNGMTVEVVAQDDQCKPELATNAATKMVSDGVKIVLGHICSGATKAALPIYLESKIVLMSPSATNPPLTQSGEYPNFFRTIAPDDAQAALEVAFAKGLGLTKLAVIHDKGDYGKGFATFCKEFIEAEEGMEVVLFEGVTPGAVDYSAVVQKIKSSGAQGVIFGGYHPEASKIVSGMRKKEITIPFLSDDGVKDDTFIKVAGEYAEGVYATGPMDFSTNPVYQEAVAAHKAEFGTDPGPFFPEAYSAALALLKAVENAGSTDYDKVTEALRTQYVDTAVGSVKFDAKGDAEGVGFAVYQVQSGKYVEIK